MKNKQRTISSRSVEYMKKLIGKSAVIVNLEVKGKWLCALLDNGIYFSVLNKI